MNQEEFYENIPKWISEDKESWNHITLMAYFCHKYEQKNKVRFRLVRWSSTPGKSKESRDFSKLMKILLPENYENLDDNTKNQLKIDVIKKIYNYINWMFDYKFRSGDKSVTGTQIFLLPSMINEFERMYAAYLNKNKSNNNYQRFLEVANNLYPEIFKMHQLDDISDLKKLKKYSENYSLSQDSIENLVLNEAKKIGVLE